MALAEVDVGGLVQVVWVSLVSGVAITALFSLVVYAGARAGEARRAHHGGQATAFFLLSLLALAVFVVGVVIGVGIMLRKG